MAEAKHSDSFEQIVEWAYRTLPQEIQDLPDFPGIQVVEEPPEDILKRKNWHPGREMLGCYSGIHRTVRQHDGGHAGFAAQPAAARRRRGRAKCARRL